MKTITGTFLRLDGTPAAGATLELMISQDVTTSSGQITHARVNITLDNTGSVPSSINIWANDEVQPSGTFYTVTVNDPELGVCYKEHLVISGTSPINLDGIVPELQV